MKFATLLSTLPALPALSFMALSTIPTPTSAQAPDGPPPILDTITVTTVNYTDAYDGASLMGYLATPSEEDVPENSLPGIIILPNWDGVNEYEIHRAALFASLKDHGISYSNEEGVIGGDYVALAADIYGLENHQPESFEDRAALAGMYRTNVSLASARIESAMEVLKNTPSVDASKIAIVGYCFGGSLALNYALSGKSGVNDDGSVKSVIAFHGGLSAVTANHDENSTYPTIVPQVLVLSGGEDSQDSTRDIMHMEEALNSGNATWQLTRYSHVAHGFTGWESSAYDPYVDERGHDAAYRFLAEGFEERSLEGEVEGVSGDGAENTAGVNARPSEEEVTVEPVEYFDVEGFRMTGFMSYPDAAVHGEGPHPAVLLIHDASGPDSYEQTRAQMLSDLGYVGFAADIFGNQTDHGYDMSNRTELFIYLNSIRNNNTLYMQRINAAVQTVMGLSGVDVNNMALFGYCFGGTGVINYAISGEPNTSGIGVGGVKGIVSFHGGLSARLPIGDNIIGVRMLIQSGGDDDASSSIEDLENAMVVGEAETWEYSRYSGVEHSFTNWGDSRGRYNIRADVRSWEDSMSFLESVFGEENVVSEGETTTTEATSTSAETTVAAATTAAATEDEVAVDGSSATVITVNYTDSFDGMSMMGYLAEPAVEAADGTLPGIIILPNWDGVNEYEIQRAALFASLKDHGISYANEGEGGDYVVMAADIYGLDNHQPPREERGALAGLYRGNVTLASARIEAAMEVLRGVPSVDPTRIGVVGYCFGGSLALNYALAGHSGVGGDGSVKSVIAFHGGLSSVTANHDENSTYPTILPQVLILSGGEDSQDSTADIIAIESALNSGNATWQLSRYSNVSHGFTGWDSDAYNPYVDERSHDSAYRFLAEAFEERSLDGEVEGVTGDGAENTAGVNARPSEDEVSVEPTEYFDAEGFKLTGFVSNPDATVHGDGPYPAVILIHDASGPDSYEQTRAQMLSNLGYVGFAADIFGDQADHGYNMTNRTESRIYLNEIRNNNTLYMQRINAAVETVMGLPGVDASNIALFGYCFGGTGVINYAISGEPNTSGVGVGGVKGIVSFHGGLSARLPIGDNKINVRMLIQSGGDDDESSSIEDLENAMVVGEADTWEYSRYSGVEHSFTNWGDSRGRYNIRADVRSWEDSISFLNDVFGKEDALSTDVGVEPVGTEESSTATEETEEAEGTDEDTDGTEEEEDDSDGTEDEDEEESGAMSAMTTTLAIACIFFTLFVSVTFH